MSAARCARMADEVLTISEFEWTFCEDHQNNDRPGARCVVCEAMAEAADAIYKAQRVVRQAMVGQARDPR